MKASAQWAFVAVGAVVLAGLAAAHGYSHGGAAPARGSARIVIPADARDAVLEARIAAKEGIARDVMAGRLSLLDAAAAFRKMDAAAPACTAPLELGSAASEDEAYCRAVVAYVGVEASPEQAGDLIRGFNAEIAARLRDGTLRLQDSDGDPAARASAGGEGAPTDGASTPRVAADDALAQK